jgi:ubiquinone/menaquinone biosynthesis C-methylase UbiE
MTYFETRFKFDASRKALWKVLSAYLQRYIPEDSRIIDIGAGYCDFINNIKAQEKHGLDISNVCTRYAGKDVMVHVQPCTDLSNFDSDYFDVVFASNILEHLSWEEVELTIKEIKRILKKKGKFIVIQPNFKYAFREYFDDYTHKTIFTHVGFEDFLLSNQFKIIELMPRFLPFSIKSHLPSSPTLLKVYLRLPFKPFAKQMLVVAENIK